MKVTHNVVALVAAVGLVAFVTLEARAESVRVVEWSFNGNSNDSSGYGNAGSVDGSTSYVSGKWGQAISLAAGASVANSSAINLPVNSSDPWSINVWLKLDSEPASLSYICGFGTGVDVGGTDDIGNQRAFINFGSGFYFWGNAADIDSGAAYGSDANWHMFTITSDGVNLSMYRDSSLVKGPEALPALQATASQVRVGGVSTWNATWTGSVDEFTVWRGALTQAQINSLATVNAIPEPCTCILLVSGLCGILAWAARKGK